MYNNQRQVHIYCTVAMALSCLSATIIFSARNAYALLRLRRLSAVFHSLILDCDHKGMSRDNSTRLVFIL